MKFKKIASILLMTATIAQNTYAAVTPSPTPAPASVEVDEYGRRILTPEEVAAGWEYMGNSDVLVAPPEVANNTPVAPASSRFGDGAFNSSTPATNPLPLGQDVVPGYVAPAIINLMPEEISRGQNIDTVVARGDEIGEADYSFYLYTYVPYANQQAEAKKYQANLALGLPETAIVDPASELGAINLWGKDIYMGEFKSSIEAKLGASSRVVGDQFGGSSYVYENGADRFLLSYGDNGRLCYVQVQKFGWSYGGITIGDTVDKNRVLRENESWVPGGAITLNRDYSHVSIWDKEEYWGSVVLDDVYRQRGTKYFDIQFIASSDSTVYEMITLSLRASDAYADTWTH